MYITDLKDKSAPEVVRDVVERFKLDDKIISYFNDTEVLKNKTADFFMIRVMMIEESEDFSVVVGFGNDDKDRINFEFYIHRTLPEQGILDNRFQRFHPMFLKSAIQPSTKNISPEVIYDLIYPTVSTAQYFLTAKVID